jgi:transcriptional regulator with XRE-family HTH domain
MSVVDRVRELCKKKDTNLNALEKELGFGRSTISKWEKVSPSIDKLTRVANYFHVSVDYLIGNDGEEMPIKIRTIAAHLEDKEITDKKMDMILKYLNALFDEEEKKINDEGSKKQNN